MPIKTAEEERRARASQKLEGSTAGVLVVTDLHNVRYLSGFTGSNAALLLFRERPAVLITDPRYTVQSRLQVNCRVRIAKGPLMKTVGEEIGRSRITFVGFERDHMTVAQRDALAKELPARASLEPTSGLIEGLRAVKDAGELEKIRASVECNSRALDAALKRFKPGIRESDLAAEIDYQSRKLGAEAPAFDTIVAAGARAALPHAQPGASRIAPGMLLIDMGAFREGYASDMTRMVHVGAAGTKYKRVYRAVLEAQLAAIDAVKAGVTTHSVDQAARRTLKRHGFAREFIHSTGHGLGLEIHELPRIGRNDKGILEAGMAITIEPGVYIEGWGGIRIEDTVLVTKTGCEILTPTPKDLIETEG